MDSILIISPFLPYPLNSGGQQGLFNIIDRLRLSYRVSLLFPLDQNNRKSSVNELSKLWPEVEFFPYPFWRQITYIPFLISKIRKFVNRKFNLRKENAILKDSLENRFFPLSHGYNLFLRSVINKVKPDIIEVNFYTALNVVDILPTDIKKIFIHHEIRYIVTNRIIEDYSLCVKQQRKILKLKEEELSYLNKYDAVVALTAVDKKILETDGVKVKIFTSPLAVNTPSKNYVEWNRKIVFVGGYYHAPNHQGMDWLINHVIPRIKDKNGQDIELVVIGKDWPQKYNKTVNGVKINCLGFVDNLAEFAYGGIMVVPILTGSGMRMKILDASALSMPFITTSVGVEGLSFEDMRECIIADDATAFADGLEKLMMDNQLRQLLANSAHKVFMDKYSVDAAVRQREDIYKRVLNN